MTGGINRGRPLRADAKRARLETVAVPQELVLRFARLWYRFGGGEPLDIMTTFGWTSERYFCELQRILRAGSSMEVENDVREAMLQVCDDRLRTARTMD